MSQNNENKEITVAQWLNWSAREMKKAAEETRDPTIKKQLQQIAGINREYRDKLGFCDGQKGNREITKEIEIIKAAYFCQQSIFWRFSMWPLEEKDALIDEIVDAQKTIVRQLYSEITKRDNIL